MFEFRNTFNQRFDKISYFVKFRRSQVHDVKNFVTLQPVFISDIPEI